MSVHQPVPHDSAHLHVTGEALYIDDINAPAGCLHGAFGLSSKANAAFTLDLSAVNAFKGVTAVFIAEDLPHNDISPMGKNDEPVLALKHTQFHGQPLFLVIADTRDHARLAALQAVVTYEEQSPLLSIDDALKDKRLVSQPLTLKRGEKTKTQNTLTGGLKTGQQDHFYLESHVALAVPQDDGGMHVFSSTQHPSEVQHMVAHMLHLPSNAVTVEVRRMGGAFGGKETQSNIFAVAASFAASRLKKAVKIRPSRDDDMIMTGKRHDFQSRYEVGFTNEGLIKSVEAEMAARAGFSADLSGPISDRALFHADNCYFYPHVSLKSLPLFTNTVSNTAFRGFGGPQGMMLAEKIIEEIAFATNQDPLDIRLKNLYSKENAVTPYHQQIEDFGFTSIIKELEASSDYRARRLALKEFNAASRFIKKGLALTPVKFGISFTATWYNQASALIHIYQDGSILVSHGGTEMGQGLYIKIQQVVATSFGVPLSFVKVSSTRTDKVPNTSATAASSGADMNGFAALNAAVKIKERLISFIFDKFGDTNPVFEDGFITINGAQKPFAEVVKAAYMARVHLSDTGFYKTPDIHWDRETGRGNPFYYYACGAACSEVSVDILTGETVLTRVDILHEAGNSLNPAIDLGQIEGGFMQGLGWLTTEEVVYSDKGKLLTHAPSTYKIPLASNRPREMRVDFVKKPNSKDTLHKSKAVGEPPLMLALSAFYAISDAISSVRDYTLCPRLNAPATPEKILMSVEELKKRS